MKYFYTSLCMCGRVYPGFAYRSRIAFPNWSANNTFMFLRKILTLSGVLWGFTLSRSGITFYSGSVSFLIFHKSMSTPALLSIKSKGNYLTKAVCQALVRENKLKVTSSQDLSNTQMGKQYLWKITWKILRLSILPDTLNMD